MAHHFTEAGLVELAIDYWLKAGQQATRRSANAEALNHVARGLQLLPQIENPRQRNRWELLLQISLGNSLRATRGWSVDDVKRAYTRALELCRNSGFDEHTLSAAFGLWTWSFVHGALGEARLLAEHLVSTAGDVDDPACKVLAYEALGFTLFACGNFAASHVALERSLSLCEDGKAAVYLGLSAQDPRVHVRLYDGMALCLLGYPERALRICADACRYAESSQHPFSEAMARTISLRVYQFRGEASILAEQANTAIALCEEHDFVHYLALALILRGWAVAQQGEFEKGFVEIQQGLDKARAAGALLFESYALGLLADACIMNKRYEQALTFLEQAEFRLDQENSERFYAAEIYRLFGDAYLRSDRTLDLAEAYFSKGLTVAREQTAKLFELRISLSIYDFYQQGQNSEKYRSQLKKIYQSFDEGFDTTDLLKAKARLINT